MSQYACYIHRAILSDDDDPVWKHELLTVEMSGTRASSVEKVRVLFNELRNQDLSEQFGVVYGEDGKPLTVNRIPRIPEDQLSTATFQTMYNTYPREWEVKIEQVPERLD